MAMDMPPYAQNAIMNQGQGMGMGMGGQFGGALGGILGGLFGSAGDPFRDAMGELDNYFPQAQGYEQPFYDAGVGALGKYQDWLGGMSDPSKFINGLMGQYQESPTAQYLKRQANLAGTNAASASGLIGSTPFLKQAQQNASNISNQDMNSWLQNVLGINSQYGKGMFGLAGMGQNSANALAEMLGNLAASKAELGAAGGMADNQQLGNLLGGIGTLAGLL